MVPIYVLLLLLFPLLGAAVSFCASAKLANDNTQKLNREIAYLKLRANTWESTARQYHKAYHEQLNKQKTVTASSKETAVSWRVIFGFAKDQKLTKSDINSRYKKLAMVHHPDQGGTNYGITLLNLAKEKADKEFN